MQALVFGVEQQARVQGLVRHAELEMQVLGGSPPGAARQCDRIARFHHIVDRDEVARVVRIGGFHAVIVANHNDIAIPAVRFGHSYHTGESGTDRIVRNGFDVHPGVHRPAPVAESGNLFTRIGIAEIAFEFCERNFQFAGRWERIVQAHRDADVSALRFAESHPGQRVAIRQLLGRFGLG